MLNLQIFKSSFSSLSDINATLKVGITITWSFPLRNVISTTSLWREKISHNYFTPISVCDRSISWWKLNKNTMSSQYRVPIGWSGRRVWLAIFFCPFIYLNLSHWLNSWYIHFWYTWAFIVSFIRNGLHDN